jgi:alginate O-acetyltransferase complex protein AlgI
MLSSRAPPRSMLFSSTLFLFQFLPIVLVLYYALGRRAWNAVLLVASLVFYAWGEELLVGLMLFSILANYLFGLWIDRDRARTTATGRRSRTAITVAIVFNVGLLCLFKYADWLWESARHLAGDRDPVPLGTLLFGDSLLRSVVLTPEGHIRLPLGISFFTFHALSYVIDIFRGDGVVQRAPTNFALYIALFPQLIAGPIIRYRDVDHQLASRLPHLARFASGVRRFVVGLGKKVLIANIAGGLADEIFAAPKDDITASVAWLAVFAYWMQLYFDFSGYSDMAIGLGRMFGFEFRENFDYPYISKSVTEYWRRWHISLSTWFRDYLYIPMGGNRVSPLRTSFNLMTVFVLCGMWHGANWNYVLFGVHHGFFLSIERLGLGARLERLPAVLRLVYLHVVVMMSYVLFRAENLELARTWYAAMFGFQAGAPTVQYAALHLDSLRILVLIAGVIGATPWVPAVKRWLERRQSAGAGSIVLPAAAHVALFAVLVLSAMELTAGTYNPFIYFRF